MKFDLMNEEEKKVWVDFNRNCTKIKIPKPSKGQFDILFKHSGKDINVAKKKWVNQMKIFNNTF